MLRVFLAPGSDRPAIRRWSRTLNGPETVAGRYAPDGQLLSLPLVLFTLPVPFELPQRAPALAVKPGVSASSSSCQGL